MSWISGSYSLGPPPIACCMGSGVEDWSGDIVEKAAGAGGTRYLISRNAGLAWNKEARVKHVERRKFLSAA